MKDVLSQLAPADIRVVLLKGIALIHELYKDEGLRPMSDVDLWVLPENLNRLTAVLTRIGYEQGSLYPTTFRKDLTTLDLKTHILGADRIKSRTLLLAKGQQHIFGNARILRKSSSRKVTPLPTTAFPSIGAATNYVNSSMEKIRIMLTKKYTFER